MLDETRKVMNKLMSVVSRAVVDLRDQAGAKLYQVLWSGDSVSADVEYMQPQGVHFQVPKNAQGLILSPTANKSASVLINASGKFPDVPMQDGEGGLHLLGTYKVWLDKDGTLHLGQVDPGDWVALASKVKAELDKVKQDLDALKQWIDTHVHGTAMGPSAPPTQAPSPTAHTPGSVASQAVKCL